MKWIGRARLVVAGVLAICAADAVRATTFVLMNEEQLAVRSTAAVLGTVTEIETARDPASGSALTYVHIDPSETVFGDLPPGELVLRERGGSIDGIREWVFGTPEYTLGEEVLVFVATSADGALHTTGMSMGKYEVTEVSGRLGLRRRLGEGTRVLQPNTGQLVANPAPETYDLDRFVGAVRKAARSTRSRRNGNRRRPIRPIPPELTDDSVREWHDSFTFLGVPARWFEPDDGTSIGYFVDQTGDSGLGPVVSRAAVDAAFAAWSSVGTSNLRLVDSGLTVPLAYNGCSAPNRVAFNDPFGEIDDPVDCAGVLAIGGYCSSSTTRVVNGTTFRKIANGKVMFNNGWSGCFGWNECNVAEVATHELGHTLGIGHSADSSATMAAFAHFDGRCADLESDDIAAVTFMYPVLSLPTATTTPSATRTQTAPPTQTPTITSTVTQTQTQTQTPTATARATSTERPTVTARPTSTPRPTSTSTAPPTSTSTVPPSATTTVLATSTETPVSAFTNTQTATPSATLTSTATPTPTSTTLVMHRVSGRVRYYSNATGVPGTSVHLRGATDVTTQTTDSGAYAFDDVSTGIWEIEPEGTTGGNRAVSALDAAYVLQAVVGTRTLTPMQRLACDVTGDGSLSSLDAARILQYSVGSLAELPVTNNCESPWLFIPMEQVGGLRQLVQPNVSAGQCQNGKILLASLSDELGNQDFDALRFGDCTGNWKPQASDDSVGPVSTEQAQSLIQLGRLRRVNSTTVRLPIYVRPTEPFQALSLSFNYDPTQLEPIDVTSRRPSPDTQVHFDTQMPGQLAIAVASGKRMSRRRSALLSVEFVVRDQHPMHAPVRLSRLTIDENSPIVLDAGAPARRR